MGSDNFLLTIAIIAVAVSLFGLGFTYFTLDNFRENWLTGYVTQGTVNISVSSIASINFSTANINWGSGSVTIGQTSATLDTSSNSVTNGNWTQVGNGFVIENIGNANVSIELATGEDAAGFIGGTSPSYQYNVSNVEADSCTAADVTLATFYDVNKTVGVGTRVCNPLNFIDASDTIRIDLKLVVPYNSKTGVLSDTMTATASA